MTQYGLAVCVTASFRATAAAEQYRSAGVLIM